MNVLFRVTNPDFRHRNHATTKNGICTKDPKIIGRRSTTPLPSEKLRSLKMPILTNRLKIGGLSPKTINNTVNVAPIPGNESNVFRSKNFLGFIIFFPKIKIWFPARNAKHSFGRRGVDQRFAGTSARRVFFSGFFYGFTH